MRQMIRYGLFGLLVNLILYLLFLWMVAVGINPHLSQLLVFLMGTVMAYGLNRRYTFTDDKPWSATLPRYLLLYGSFYLISAALLALLLHAGMPPWAGQAICIIVSAVGLFVAQKLLIFESR
jgi:putative flippase GtrA